MTSGEKSSVHPHEVYSPKNTAILDTRLRRFINRPDRLAEKYVKPGGRILDISCGPGFFTWEFAKRVGEGGGFLPFARVPKRPETSGRGGNWRTHCR